MPTIFDTLLAQLDACSWPEIEELAKATKVPFHTIAKIKRRDTPNPRINTVQKLTGYFNAAPKKRKASA